MRAIHSVAVTALTVALACGGDGNGPNRNQFVGTWDATKLEFTNKANPAQIVDVIAAGATFVASLEADGTYQIILTVPGQAPEVSTGTWSASADILTFQEGQVSTTQFSWSLSGNTLTLSGADSDFDFDGDDVNEPAKLGGVFVRR